MRPYKILAIRHLLEQIPILVYILFFFLSFIWFGKLSVAFGSWFLFLFLLFFVELNTAERPIITPTKRVSVNILQAIVFILMQFQFRLFGLLNLKISFYAISQYWIVFVHLLLNQIRDLICDYRCGSIL